MLLPWTGIAARLGIQEPEYLGFALFGVTPFTAAFAYWRVGRLEFMSARANPSSMMAWVSSAIVSVGVVVTLGHALDAHVSSVADAITRGREDQGEGALRTLRWLYRFPGIDVSRLATSAQDMDLDDDARARLSDAWTSITGQPIPSD